MKTLLQLDLMVLLCLSTSAEALKARKTHSPRDGETSVRGDDVHEAHRRLPKSHDSGYYKYSSGRGGVSKNREIVVEPSQTPSIAPSNVPSVIPSVTPSDIPSVVPSESEFPSTIPSDNPTATPSNSNAPSGSSLPSGLPTLSSQPSVKPSVSPSADPSNQPSIFPTFHPSDEPSLAPTVHPSGEPSVAPTVRPSVTPTARPSVEPSLAPTSHPSEEPSMSPTPQPSEEPSSSPTDQPTLAPSPPPTAQPTLAPSPLPTAQPTIKVYTGVDSSLWPNDRVWRNELESQLSPNANLFNHMFDNDGDTEDAWLDLCWEGTTFDWIHDGDGVCTIPEQCQFQFCNWDGRRTWNLPAYTVDARTEGDIQQAFSFANRYNIPVTIKTTGHNYVGSSIAKESLNIWMVHYPTDGTITENFQNTCGDVYPHTVGINGGELFDDVMHKVRDQFHMVTGGQLSVSASGGWLQGVGLSFTSRKYGLGIDNVLQFEVITPQGDLLTADACTNVDLFWALRGGGGGTFGVVTHVEYKLLPVVPVTIFNIWVSNRAGRRFLRWWLGQDFHPDVAGAWFRAYSASVFVVGDWQEAYDKFLRSFDQFIEDELEPLDIDAGHNRNRYTDWYGFMGGDGGYQVYTDHHARGEERDTLASRIIPLAMVEDALDATVDFLLDVYQAERRAGSDGFEGYLLGGAVNEVGVHATAVHPAMRSAFGTIITYTEKGGDLVRTVLNNDVSGCAFNHHAAGEPNWRTSLWGVHYFFLKGVKNRYDPDHRLNCWHCVDYQGLEFEASGDER